MKLLIKRAFKSIFKNKLFMALMFILVFISGFTFTLLDSSANSFKNSYNSVVVDGNLHDMVVKENFKVNQNYILDSNGQQILDPITGQPQKVSELELGIYDDITDPQHPVIIPITPGNIELVTKDQKYNPTPGNYRVDLRIMKATGDFLNIPRRNESLAIIPFKEDGVLNSDGSKNWVGEAQIVQNVSQDWKADLVTMVESNLSDFFKNALNEIYGTGTNATHELLLKNTKTISVSSGDNAYKLVSVDPKNDQVNKLFMYDGTNNFTKSREISEMRDELRQIITSLPGGDITQYTFNTLKGYKVTATPTSGVGKTLTAIDPSAYQAVVSPGYANSNNKTSISPVELKNLYTNDPLFYEHIGSDIALQNKYKNNLVWVDKTPYFIIGIGTTPDFSYPIIDEQHPTVDVDNQAVLFVNNNGYQRAFDAWRTNPQENYISIKFNQGVSEDRKQVIDNEISNILLNGNKAGNVASDKPGFISPETRPAYDAAINKNVYIPTSFFPQNIDVVTSAQDKNDVMLLVQERTSVLDSLQNTISTLSISTTFLLAIFVSSIVVLVFNVLFTINRKSLATMMALGHSRTKIAFSTAFISLFVGLLPSVIGYLAGFGSQYVFIDSFSSYWTLPAYGDPFSWLSLVITVGVPFIFLGLLIFVIVLSSLRHPLTDMLKDSVGSESSVLAKVTGPMKFLGARGKYSFALSFKNAGKLTLAGLTMTISLIALMVGFSTVGASARAYSATQSMNKYQYQIDLFSPTAEGGEYNVLLSNDNKVNGLLNLPILPTFDPNNNNNYSANVNPDIPHWHVPSTADRPYGLPDEAMQTQNIVNASTYLKNMLQIKPLLNLEVVKGMNPWTIASKLMPENQLNILNSENNYFANELQTIYAASQYETPLLPRNQYADEAAYNQAVLEYNISKLKYMLLDPENVIPDDKQLPYIISYGTVITDPNDEPYTYLDTEFDLSGHINKYHIVGLDENTKMINISHEDLQALDDYRAAHPNTLPIYINRYMAEYLNLSAGDTFEITINNDANRNNVAHKNNPHKVTVDVRGVVEGYDDGGLYTTQSIANEIIGLSQKGFNGVFANNQDSTLLSSMPLYSPSGLYLGTDTIIGPWEKTLDAMLQDPRIWNNPAHQELGINTVDEFIAMYSRTPFVGATSNVHWQEINEQTFKTTSELTNTLIWLAEGISISLSIIFMSIVSMLMFSSNKKKMATLWTIGYRRREIFRIFLGTYVIPMLIAIAISIPIAFGIVEGIRFFIMGFGHILVPVSITIWIPFVAIAIVASIFIIATFISAISQRPNKSLAAFKE